jgi:lysophospholipase L1-like esterase
LAQDASAEARAALARALFPSNWFRAERGLRGDSRAEQRWDNLVEGRSPLIARLHGPTVQPQCFEAGGCASLRFFAGAGPQYLDAGDVGCFASLHSAPGATVLLAFVPRGIRARQTLLSSYGRSANAGRGVLFQYDPGRQAVELSWSNAGRLAGAGVTDEGSVILGQPTVLVVRTDALTQRWTARAQGSAVGEGRWISSPSDSETASAFALRLGAVAGETVAGFDGDILEFRTYDRPLSDAELLQIEQQSLAECQPTPTLADTQPLAGPALAGTVRVVALGDSITLGTTGAISRIGGWRHRVNERRGELAFALDFVGSQSYGDFADNQHEAHSGWVIDNRIDTMRLRGFTEGSTNDGTIAATLTHTDPDIVVVLAGINTLTAGDDSVTLSRDALTDYRDLILQIHARRAAARVVVVPLTLTTGVDLRESRRRSFNAGLGSVARFLRAQGVPLIIADTPTALAPDDLSDGLHPNDQGYARLGDRILQAIVLASGGR